MNNEKIVERKKNWILKNTTDESVEHAIFAVAGELGINPVIAKLLYNRGYTDAAAMKSFLYMEKEMLCNPFLMKDMDKGVERIRLAIERKEKITIYGDYDVDGVTSVCTLYLYLQKKGAIVDYYIPNRAGEGYGVSNQAIDTLKEQGTKLIITVDTGITAINEVNYAATLGIDFLITDHHECHSEIPNASAVINPHQPDCNYPFKELAGVGVVFKLVSAYEERALGFSRRVAAEHVFAEYADIVAIGTIADVMPIKSENRLIVSYGLNMIENTSRPGLLALMDATNQRDSKYNERRKKRTKITSGYIGYTVAPRINAAGRVRSASLAVELFLEKNIKKAEEISHLLCEANKERQAEENKIMQEAYAQIELENLDKDFVMVLNSNGWHHGVIGIVASRITEKYSRPTILVSFETDSEPSPTDMGKGSGRSIKGLNLVEALCYCDEYLEKFGGHELAAGLSVTRENLPLFREKINEFARNNLTSSDMVSAIEADMELRFSEVSLSLAADLQILEPYGVGNPMPVFVSKAVNVNEITAISEGKHTRFSFGEGKNTVNAMFFSNSPDSLGLFAGDLVDIVYNIDINEWLGRRSVQLNIKDIRRSNEQGGACDAQRSRFDEIWNGATYSPAENVLPSREDFAAVYRFIANSVRQGVDELSHKDIILGMHSSSDNFAIGYIKLKIIIKVFAELNILSINEFQPEQYKFKVYYSSSKTDLDKSHLLRRIRCQQEKVN
ncbi:MAG: single-stranded-DNA-specific exonuclease RecJ [Clostridia bacterium]|nr:single-stranded-DNA-specific exonuclease RecJ [Clostridia bacterium]